MSASGQERVLSGWGRYPRLPVRVAEPDGMRDAAAARDASALIARGNGRSYGDASLGTGLTVGTRRLDRLIAFDPATGRLTCEAGVLLATVLDVFLPRGWFPPVTPGTKFVSVGGMVASDVHGKNHHRAGSFCEHVTEIRLALGDGTVLTCSQNENADLFAATCGGMGLTGVILEVTFTLIPVGSARIRQHRRRAANLGQAFAIFGEVDDATYSVAWIDCLATGREVGRSVVITGEHAAPDDLPDDQRATPFARPGAKHRRVPLDMPPMLLNRASVRAFNRLYYRVQTPGTALVDIEPFFYPLDALLEWNRIYGRRGFVQFQCVLPTAASAEGLAAMLGLIAREGTASFLAVLKRLGPASFGLLSFPMEGFTLALDFPATAATFALLARLDDIVAAHAGRVYLAKDACTSARHVEAGYPRLDAFRAVRRKYGVDARFASALSTRLEL